jgi:hypothetical protein
MATILKKIKATFLLLKNFIPYPLAFLIEPHRRSTELLPPTLLLNLSPLSFILSQQHRSTTALSNSLTQ